MADDPILLSQVVAEERSAILGSQSARPLSALCISGGGIRSATFALGAIQGLAKKGLLPGFDYLSTVSGGGYIGSWLSAWIAREKGDLSKVIPRLRDDPPPPPPHVPDPIQHLRDFNNYLTPKLGGLSADTWTVVATVVRNIALNWLVLLPLLLAFLMVPRILLSLARLSDYYYEVGWDPQTIAGSSFVEVGLPVLMTFLFCLALFQMWRYLPGVGGCNHTEGQYFRWILLPLAGATVCFCAYDALSLWEVGIPTQPLTWYVRTTAEPAAATWLLYLIVCGKPFAIRLQLLWKLSFSILLLALFMGAAEWLIATQLAPFLDWGVYVTVVPPLIGICFCAALAIFAGISSTFLKDRDREWMSRASSAVLLACVVWMGGCFLVLMAPTWVFTWKTWGDGVIAAAGTAAGWMSARSRDTAARSGPGLGAIAVKVAPVVFIVALALALAVGTNLLLDKTGVAAVPKCNHPAYVNTPGAVIPWTDHEVFLEHCSWWGLTFTLAAFLGTALVAAWFININKFSLHAMYRDRLIRAYLGASNPERYQCSESARTGPNQFTGFAQSDNLPIQELAQYRPFHVVNVCLNLVAGDRLAWQQRKAASFTFTPLHCGSRELGYRPSSGYGKGNQDAISLGTAITISGAAASPNMGYHSSPATGFIMTLLNARLGAWLGNPGKAGNRSWKDAGPRSAAFSLLREAFGLTNARSKYVYLSDGGHFENLGLYEMIQRRCGTIVVLDGGCDATLTYEDLGNALRKIRIDMDTEIRFSDAGIDGLRAREKRCAVADIHYPDGTIGQLIYVKPLREGSLPPDVASYAAAHLTFPHQSTADQWFDESQTESYRMLGELTMDEICAEWQAGAAVAGLPKHVMGTYLAAKGKGQTA
jgi:Patatin-like phospholipase